MRLEKGPEEKTIKNHSALNLSAHDELIHLRKENEQLRIEREILKSTNFAASCLNSSVYLGFGCLFSLLIFTSNDIINQPLDMSCFIKPLQFIRLS
jgi:hypothetical protein